MKRNQLRAGAFLSYFQMALSIIIGIVYTPYMIRLLGQSEYGLYNTVASTISMLSVLNLGFNSGYIRYFSQYKSKDDQDGIKKLNGLFLLIFTIIGIVALICGLFLSFHLELVFDQGLTADEYKIAQVLMILLTFNLAVSFPMSVFSTIISSHERFVVLKLLGIFKTVVGPFVTLPLLLAGFRSIAMVVVTVSVTLIIDVVYLFYVVCRLKQKFVFHDFEKGLFKSLFFYTLFIAINIVVDQINTNMGKVLLGRYQGTIAVSIYAVASTLYGYYVMFSTSVSGIFTPRIHSIQNSGADADTLRKNYTDLFVRVGRIQFLIMGLIASGLVFFGKEFITHFWAGSEYGESYYVMLLLILPAIVPLIQNIGIEIQRAQNKHHFRSITYLIMAIVNLVLTAVLCQRFGAVGAAVGTAVALLLANGLIMNIYYYKSCNVDTVFFWKNILRMSLGLIAPAVSGIVIRYFFDLTNFLQFAGGIILYALVYCASVWLISMNSYEKYLIKKPLKKWIWRKA